MRKFLLRLAFLIMPWTVLISCTHMPVVLWNGCEIPEQLDHEAKGPVQLPEGKPIPPQEFVVQWANERHEHAGIAADYNDLRDHVKANCQ